jgi:hypothetical protein
MMRTIALLLAVCCAAAAATARVRSHQHALMHADAGAIAHEATHTSGAQGRTAVDWSTKQALDAILADLDAFAAAYRFKGTFVLTASTAAMVLGCRRDTYGGRSRKTARRTKEERLTSIDVWIPEAADFSIIAGGGHGAVSVTDGYQWLVGRSDLGNVYRLDVRDGGKRWKRNGFRCARGSALRGIAWYHPRATTAVFGITQRAMCTKNKSDVHVARPWP